MFKFNCNEFLYVSNQHGNGESESTYRRTFGYTTSSLHLASITSRRSWLK